MVDATGRYVLENAYMFLESTGMAHAILDQKERRGIVEISYSRVRPSNTKHRGKNFGSTGKYYFKFVYNPIAAVISLVDDDPLNGSVKLTDKTLIMTNQARENFRRGWNVMEERYGNNGH